MIAGYETASTALAYITHILATHRDEQKKLQDYIDSYLNKDTILNYDIIDKMDYLEWFIQETLRMYPITPIIINRECSEEIDLPGIGRISPGTKITLDMYSLHYDNDLWGPVDTKIFYPERFATKRHPLAWVAFGVGPRKCLGMRFALSEIKITIIRLLQNYTIIPASTNGDDLDLVELVTISPKQVPIRLEQRADKIKPFLKQRLFVN
jgi:cytochrome P450